MTPNQNYQFSNYLSKLPDITRSNVLQLECSLPIFQPSEILGIVVGVYERYHGKDPGRCQRWSVTFKFPGDENHPIHIWLVVEQTPLKKIRVRQVG